MNEGKQQTQLTEMVLKSHLELKRQVYLSTRLIDRQFCNSFANQINHVSYFFKAKTAKHFPSPAAAL